TLMRAIETSSKRDVRGAHVFDRFNLVSLVNQALPFGEWIVHLRVAAQQIRESIVSRRRVTKRTHEQATHETHDTVPVSYAAPSQARPAPFRAARAVCRQMLNTGSCSDGSSCKYSHAV